MKITEEQLKDLYFFRDMFESHAVSLEEICEDSTSKMEIGFRIGKINSYLKQHSSQMFEFIKDIENANRG